MRKPTFKDYFYIAMFFGVTGAGIAPAMLLSPWMNGYSPNYSLASGMMAVGIFVALVSFGLGALGGLRLANNHVETCISAGNFADPLQ